LRSDDTSAVLLLFEVWVREEEEHFGELFYLEHYMLVSLCIG
jgi:hypothetical protein